MTLDDALEQFRSEVLAALRDFEQRLGARIDAGAAETRRVEERLSVRIDASAAETRRHMGALAEDLRSKIAILAESVVTLNERLAAEMREGFEVVDRRLLRVEARLLSGG